jgi:hypothetical protein
VNYGSHQESQDWKVGSQEEVVGQEGREHEGQEEVFGEEVRQEVFCQEEVFGQEEVFRQEEVFGQEEEIARLIELGF